MLSTSLKSPDTAILAFSVAFIVMALIQLLSPGPQPASVQINNEISAEAAIPANLAAAIDPADDYAAITEMPLFTTSRQPYAAPVVQTRSDVTSEPTPAPEPEATPSFTIQGIIRAPQTQIALLQVDGGSVERVQVGDTIQGWDVSAIANNQVTISRNGETQTLLLMDNSSTSD